MLHEFPFVSADSFKRLMKVTIATVPFIEFQDGDIRLNAVEKYAPFEYLISTWHSDKQRWVKIALDAYSRASVIDRVIAWRTYYDISGNDMPYYIRQHYCPIGTMPHTATGLAHEPQAIEFYTVGDATAEYLNSLAPVRFEAVLDAHPQQSYSVLISIAGFKRPHIGDAIVKIDAGRGLVVGSIAPPPSAVFGIPGPHAEPYLRWHRITDAWALEFIRRWAAHPALSQHKRLHVRPTNPITTLEGL